MVPQRFDKLANSQRRGNNYWIWLGAGMLAIALSAQADGGESQRLMADRLIPLVREHVSLNSPWRSENLEIRLVNYQPLELPAGPVKLRLLRRPNRIAPGYQNYLLAAEVAGREVSRTWIKAEVRVFDDVVVASTPVARNDFVNSNDVKLTRRELAASSRRPFTEIEEVIGKQARRTLEPNEILTTDKLQQPTLVRRNSPVVMVLETGLLRIDVPGVAQENGKAGELIKVKNPTSGKIIQGTVVDERTVKVP